MSDQPKFSIVYITLISGYYDPPDFHFFGSQVIRISSVSQDYVSAYLSCARDSSVVFYDDNEGIHHILQHLMTSKDIASYWDGPLYKFNESTWRLNPDNLRHFDDISYLPEDKCYVYVSTSPNYPYSWTRKLVSCAENHTVVCVYQGQCKL